MIRTVDLTIFPIEIVLRACHALSVRCSIAVRRDGTAAVLELTARDPSDALDDLERTLADALLDQSLRATIAAETRGIRELLVAQAFCEADLLDRRDVDADEYDDPRNIAVTR